MKTLHDLVLHELAAIYDAEQQLGPAWAWLETAATGERLQRILRRHGKETAEHVTKLATVFAHFGATPNGRLCNITTALLDKATLATSTFKDSPALDAALIGVVQQLEHHEIATYGCLVEWSELLGNAPATAILQSILEEEKTANEALTQLARARSNSEANVQPDAPATPARVRAAKATPE